VRIRLLGWLACGAMIVVALTPLVGLARPEGRLTATDRAVVVTVSRVGVGSPIPAGFLGLSTEFRGIEAYAGPDSGPIDPVFLRLVRSLTPGQRPVLRIGGDSTDWSWWPVTGVRRPAGVRYAVTDNWLRRVRAVASALDARLILGVNLAADNRRVAGAEARALVDGVGAQYISALELGNEPELYASFPWEVPRGGPGRPARGSGWSFDRYLADWGRIGRALPAAPLAGPATGSLRWMAQLGRFMSAAPRVRLLTVHRYALKLCGATGNQTIGELWSNPAADGLAAHVEPTVALARARRVPVRIDEVNSIACGGQPGVSNTFAAALWALDALFAIAHTGVVGVNFHTEPGSLNELFSVTRSGAAWRASVHPEYYGLLMFAQAAPLGARLLQISGSSPSSRLRVWATRARDGVVRVVVINKYLRGDRVVALRVRGVSGPAVMESLRAPGSAATAGVTLGGQTFGVDTVTGSLIGAPRTSVVKPVEHRYTLTVPAATAVMLTMNGRA
jgi:hypothetical protein